MAILGNVGAMLGPLWEVLGSTWVHSGVRVWGFVFKVWGLGFDHHNAYLVEMPNIALDLNLCSENTRLKNEYVIKH